MLHGDRLFFSYLVTRLLEFHMTQARTHRSTPSRLTLFLSLLLAGLASWSAPALHAQADELGEMFSASQERVSEFTPGLNAVLESSPTEKDAKRRTLVDSLQDSLGATSRVLSAQLQRRKKAGLQNLVDVLVVGAGIHSAIFNHCLGKARPDVKLVCVESSAGVAKTFWAAGQMFRLNSPELETLSSNILPQAPVQLKQLTGDRFAHAEMIGDVALFAQVASPATFLLRSKVKAIDMEGDLVKTTLDSGITFHSKAVVVATGLGTPRWPTQDAVSLEILKTESDRQFPLGGDVPDVQYFDSALHRAKADLTGSFKPLDAYRDKKVCVVGAGDGANVWVEFMLGKAPAPAYGGDADSRISGKLLWIGQKATDLESFRGSNKKRYHESFVSIYAEERLENVPARLESIRAAGEGAPGKYALTCSDGKTYHADKVILATGYQNRAAELVQSLGADVSFEPITGPTPEWGMTNIARQATAGGKAHPIYLAGAGAAPLATDAELAKSFTMNSVSINVLASRTESLARKIAAELAP